MSAPVIGIVGNDVPRQLLLAAGAVPRRLFGSWSGEIDPRAAELLGAVDSVVVRILADLLAGGAGDLDAIVVCNDSEAHLKLFYMLRVSTGEGLPPVHLVDLPRRDSAAAREFASYQFQSLTDFVSSITRRQVDSGSLAAAAARERRLGTAIARLRGHRRESASGTAALSALMDAAVLPPDDAIDVVDAVASAPAVDGPSLRVLVTGSDHPDTRVFSALERHRMHVVADQSDTGELSWLGDAADGADRDTVVAGLVDRHFVREVAGPVALGADRARGAVARASTAAADVVISLLRPGDDAAAWDTASIRKALAETGLPVVVRTVHSDDDLDDLARSIGAEAGGAVHSAARTVRA